MTSFVLKKLFIAQFNSVYEMPKTILKGNKKSNKSILSLNNVKYRFLAGILSF